MCPKTSVVGGFGLFLAILIGLLKGINLLDIVRNAQPRNFAGTIFPPNLKQAVGSALGWSLCALSSGWLPEVWNLAPLVPWHWSSLGAALPMHCGFTALSVLSRASSHMPLPQHLCCGKRGRHPL